MMFTFASKQLLKMITSIIDVIIIINMNIHGHHRTLN